MRGKNQKLKLLYLMKYLLEKTDEEHGVTVYDMMAYLEKNDISAERKAIYDDIECLRFFGLDIVSEKKKQTVYYLASREFELAELKLLVDSVQSSKFITAKKSLELIKKIESLTSETNAKKLQGQVFVLNRTKTFNEQIYYNVDKIHEAISNNRQIAFKYFEWTLEKTKKYRKDGEKYVENPVALTWDDENYYLISYKPKYENYTHYRVDKMENIEILEDERIIPDKDFDIAIYAKKVFSMYGGEEKQITAKFKNHLIGVIIDRFGTETHISKLDSEHFTAIFNIALSPQFIGWFLSFGADAEIISPPDIRNDIKKLIKSVNKLY